MTPLLPIQADLRRTGLGGDNLCTLLAEILSERSIRHGCNTADFSTPGQVMLKGLHCRSCFCRLEMMAVCMSALRYHRLWTTEIREAVHIVEDWIERCRWVVGPVDRFFQSSRPCHHCLAPNCRRSDPVRVHKAFQLYPKLHQRPSSEQGAKSLTTEMKVLVVGVVSFNGPGRSPSCDSDPSPRGDAFDAPCHSAVRNRRRNLLLFGFCSGFDPPA